jgi:hypothetical protein
MPIILHHLLVEIFLVNSIVLMYDIIQYFWGHILRSGHGELSNVSKLEG